MKYNPIKLFRKMNADVGIKMNIKQAKTNLWACITGIDLLREGKSVQDSIDYVISMDTAIHPGIVKKFLTEAEVGNLI